MRSLDAKLRVLATRIADDGLNISRLSSAPTMAAIHQLELLPFHIVGE
jgi:hypothetical protein